VLKINSSIGMIEEERLHGLRGGCRERGGITQTECAIGCEEAQCVGDGALEAAVSNVLDYIL
jgi:hypothetical protein